MSRGSKVLLRRTARSSSATPTEKEMVQGNIQAAKIVNLEKTENKTEPRIKNSEKTPTKLHLLLLLVREINSVCVREKDHKYYSLHLAFLCFRFWSFSFSALGKVTPIVIKTELWWRMRQMRRQKPATIAKVNLKNRNNGKSSVHENH